MFEHRLIYFQYRCIMCKRIKIGEESNAISSYNLGWNKENKVVIFRVLKLIRSVCAIVSKNSLFFAINQFESIVISVIRWRLSLSHKLGVAMLQAMSDSMRWPASLSEATERYTRHTFACSHANLLLLLHVGPCQALSTPPISNVPIIFVKYILLSSGHELSAVFNENNTRVGSSMKWGNKIMNFVNMRHYINADDSNRRFAIIEG